MRIATASTGAAGGGGGGGGGANGDDSVDITSRGGAARATVRTGRPTVGRDAWRVGERLMGRDGAARVRGRAKGGVTNSIVDENARRK